MDKNDFSSVELLYITGVALIVIAIIYLLIVYFGVDVSMVLNIFL